MPVRQANAVWHGNLREGKGIVKLGSGAFEGRYSFTSRFEEGVGTNPEELIGAAHAGCYAMALSAGLGNAGYTPRSISAFAKVHINKVDAGFKITLIELIVEADIPGIEETAFQTIAEATKTGCPVSQALAAVPITLKAQLIKA